MSFWIAISIISVLTVLLITAGYWCHVLYIVAMLYWNRWEELLEIIKSMETQLIFWQEQENEVLKRMTEADELQDLDGWLKNVNQLETVQLRYVREAETELNRLREIVRTGNYTRRKSS